MELNSVTKTFSGVLKTDNQSLELIEGIKNNDQDAIRRIYKMYFGKIKSMVNNFRIRHLEAEDIFQEGLTRAVLNIRSGKFREDSGFYSYLYGICRNICLKEYSRKTNNPVFNDPPEVNTDEDNHFNLLERILSLRKQLDQGCREIIDLRFCQDNESQSDKCLSFEKIAEILQIQADNARQRLKRCMDRLRELAHSDREIKELME